MFQRKRIRLKGHDYSQGGYYFVTVCSYRKWCIFGEVIDDVMRLNEWGEIVNRCWLDIPNHFEHVKLDQYVVMPNHAHGIICIDHSPDDLYHRPKSEQFGKPVAGSIPTIVRSFKSASTKYINAIRGGHESIWHPNYHEHIIRDEMDLNRLQKYIMNNPKQWAMDEENPNKS